MRKSLLLAAIVYCLLCLSPAAQAYEEIDSANGSTRRRQSATPLRIVEAPDTPDPKTPPYLGDREINEQVGQINDEATQSPPLALTRVSERPAVGLGLGLGHRAFDARLGVSFAWLSFANWEPWINYFSRKQVEDEYFRYAAGGDLVLRYRLAKVFEPFVRTGIGYARWQARDWPAESGPIAQCASGVTFLFTKNFGIQFSRSIAYYPSKQPQEKTDGGRVNRATYTTNIAFYATL